MKVQFLLLCLVVASNPAVATARQQTPAPAVDCGNGPVNAGLRLMISALPAPNGSIHVVRTICRVSPGNVWLGIWGPGAFRIEFRNASGTLAATRMYSPAGAGHEIALYDAQPTYDDDVNIRPNGAIAAPATYTVVARWDIVVRRANVRDVTVTLTSNPIQISL